MFSGTGPNAYITNTLNKLFFTQSTFAIFFMRTPAAWFDHLEQNGVKSGKICFPLAFEGTKYNCLIGINHFCM